MKALDTNILVRYYTQDDPRMLLTFDDRKFARRARRLGLKPPVTVPSA